MIKTILILLCNVLWLLSCLKHYIVFKLGIKKVKDHQKKILKELITKNQESEFGKKYNFHQINSITDYQRTVPLSEYEDYHDEIKKIKAGDKRVLTKDKILLLEPTSGSSSAQKYIPYTEQLKNEFNNGIYPWLIDLFLSNKKMLLGKSYWQITPATNTEKYTEGGIKIGFEDDTEYLGPITKILHRFMQVVPSEVSKLEDTDNFYYVTLLFLLKEKYLAFISSWNPSFISLLFENLYKWSPQLIKDIENGTITPINNGDELVIKKIVNKLSPNHRRAQELKGQITKDWNYKKIWPRLTLISTWGDGNAKEYKKEIRNIFPKIKIQAKGLISTEGFISFPFRENKNAILSYRSHFFEFIEVNDENERTGNIKLAHELKIGKKYLVNITTGGGLYRYQLNDIIQVTAMYKNCPYIKFIGRGNGVSDMRGEKLHESFVTNILNDLFGSSDIEPQFFMLAPEIKKCGSCYYTLFLQSTKNIPKNTLCLLEKKLEESLNKNFHYAYARKLKQLSKAKLFIVKDNAYKDYLDTCIKNGQRLGNIKSTNLHKKTGWSKIFKGKFTEK